MKIIEIVTTTCSICKMLRPMIEKVTTSENIELQVFHADIPEEAASVQNFLDEYAIKSVPAFFFMNGDTLIGKHFGAITMPDLKKYINETKNYGC